MECTYYRFFIYGSLIAEVIVESDDIYRTVYTDDYGYIEIRHLMSKDDVDTEAYRFTSSWLLEKLHELW